MAAIYGHRWTANHGLFDEDDTWAMVLSGLNESDIQRGLGLCVKLGSVHATTGDEDWPPTAGEFREFCTRAKPTMHRYYLPPTKPEPLSESGKKAIVNGLCAAAGLPIKYLDREPGEDG